MSDAAYEITVYGEAPEDEGTTDVIQIPLDMVLYFEPAGPTLINPPIIPSGGGGGDVVNPKDEWADVEEKAIWIGVGFGVLGAILGATGAGAPVAIGVAFVGGAFGLLGFYAGNAADDPPQPDYKRVAGSTIPARKLALTSTPRLNRSVETILGVERATAVFIDAIECAQGAFMAGDVLWTQRHTKAARTAYVDCGKALLGMADTLEELADHLKPAGPTPAEVEDWLPDMIEAIRPGLDLSPDDEAHITAILSPNLARGIPTQDEIRSAITTFRRFGRRLTNPVMAHVRFAFVKTLPTGR